MKEWIYKSSYLQLVDTPTISRSLFRTETKIKRSFLETKKYENNGKKRKNYEKRFMHSKALKIHEFSFNATKIAQRRIQVSVSWKREPSIVSLAQKEYPRANH